MTRRAIAFFVAVSLGCGLACGVGCGEHHPLPNEPADAAVADATLDATGSPDAQHGETGVDAPADGEAGVDAGEDATLDAARPDDAAADAFDAEAAACAETPVTTVDAGGACNVVVQSWSDEGHTHVPDGTSVRYCTEPPSSGPHYGEWADYTTYDRPIAAPYLVHALEHGAIVITYQCATSCPAVAASLQAIIDAHPLDPMCNGTIKSRLILAPDPTLDVPVAAAAWQWTYRASCVDASSLTSFINAHYAQAAENTCSPGIVPP